jgi:hypothetical protein
MKSDEGASQAVATKSGGLKESTATTSDVVEGKKKKKEKSETKKKTAVAAENNEDEEAVDTSKPKKKEKKLSTTKKSKIKANNSVDLLISNEPLNRSENDYSELLSPEHESKSITPLPTKEADENVSF